MLFEHVLMQEPAETHVEVKAVPRLAQEAGMVCFEY